VEVAFSSSQVLVQENNSSTRTLALNRPRHMNALSLEMFSRLSDLFLAYDHDTKVKLVMLKGTGKAFSAGGDIAAIARHLTNGDWRSVVKESDEAYKLLFLIATYSKPQLSVLNGIAIGRGACIFLPSKFRIVTENSTFSIPETALGGFPDMGASYFLSRFPGFFGEYLVLTGAKLEGPEMLACGLATHFVPATKLTLLEEALACKVASTNDSTSITDLLFYISAVINEYSVQPALKETGSACHKMDVIEKCFSNRTVEEILSALEKEADTYLEDDPWMLSTIQSLKKASPTGLKISLRSIREGRSQGLGECLVREHRMLYHLVRGKVSRDFIEGCTTLLWDKNKIHKWNPCKLELVTDQMIDLFFSKLDDDAEPEELKLPERSNLRTIAKL
ncbi:3-hydroxyisobutyryl-CoA hydrolase 1, partial [Rosa chinensis]|uniref:3-hydroxyisobutyryl-CoA hydrolase 1 n=1 Tax=Rosa chinensis TaxID=74649 RepID=UPI000D09661F